MGLRARMCTLLLDNAAVAPTDLDTAYATATTVLDLVRDPYQLDHDTVFACATALSRTVSGGAAAATGAMVPMLEALSALLLPTDPTGDGTTDGDPIPQATVDVVRATAAALGIAEASRLLVGQAPTRVASALLRVSAEKLAALVEAPGGVQVQVPVSALESMAGRAPSGLASIRLNITSAASPEVDFSVAQVDSSYHSLTSVGFWGLEMFVLQ
jgi:hypothetical protein